MARRISSDLGPAQSAPDRPLSAGAAFFVSRAALWALVAAVVVWRGEPGGIGPRAWARWDGGWFLRVAEHGYASAAGAPAFFPLYPGIVGIGGRLLGDRFALAGVVVALAAGVAAFAVFWRLAELRIGKTGAWRATLLLAVFPTSLFLGAVYSESLFLLAVLGAFFFAERSAWPQAWACASLALLTRSAGIAVVVALLVAARGRPRAYRWSLLVPLVFAVFPLVLELQVHDPWAFLHAQAEWDRHVSPAGPFGGLWRGVAALWQSTPDFTRAHALAVDLEGLAAVAIVLAALPVILRVLGASYAAYTVVGVALPLTTPTAELPLLSLPRFVLVLFPVFIAGGWVLRTRSALVAALGASSVLLVVACVLWASYAWVA